jgi:hypothetical protein
MNRLMDLRRDYQLAATFLHVLRHAAATTGRHGSLQRSTFMLHLAIGALVVAGIVKLRKVVRRRVA